MAVLTEAESLDLLRKEMDKQGMMDNSLRAGTAAIAMGESALNPHTETGYAHTANSRIRTVFGARVAVLTDDELDKLKANPEEFFNRVYGGSWGAKNLGNTEPGDGYKFRGRTVLQLTGRANYEKLKQMIGYDIVSDPDLANQPNVSAAVAVGYMRWRYKGGGWEAMKAAVGNNSPDINAKKNEYFARFQRSGEMNTGTESTQTSAAADEVAEFQTSVRKIQTFLKDKGYYDGKIDGDFGKGSHDALSAYIRDR